jgi:hypothetical protein
METQKVFLYVLVGVILFIVLLIGLTKKSAGKIEEE